MKFLELCRMAADEAVDFETFWETFNAFQKDLAAHGPKGAPEPHISPVAGITKTGSSTRSFFAALYTAGMIDE